MKRSEAVRKSTGSEKGIIVPKFTMYLTEHGVSELLRRADAKGLNGNKAISQFLGISQRAYQNLTSLSDNQASISAQVKMKLLRLGFSKESLRRCTREPRGGRRRRSEDIRRAKRNSSRSFIETSCRSENTPPGYFRHLGTIHVHIDAGRDERVREIVDRLITNLASSDFPGKTNTIIRAIAGPQRTQDEFRATYQGHTPGEGNEESFEVFSTTGFGPRDQVTSDVTSSITRILSALEETRGVVVEAERVMGFIDKHGKWSQPKTLLIPTINEERVGKERWPSMPIEIHHALDFPKRNGIGNQPPVSLDQLLMEMDQVGILTGGIFLFEKEGHWSFRTSQFARYETYYDVAQEQHDLLQKRLSKLGHEFTIWTIVEQILGVWKTGRHRPKTLGVPRLATWERACNHGDQFWVLASNFLGDIDPDIQSAMEENIRKGVEYTYFLHSFADIQRLRLLADQLEQNLGIALTEHDLVRSVLLQPSQLHLPDCFIAHPCDRKRREGFALHRGGSDGVSSGKRLSSAELRDIVALLQPLTERKVAGYEVRSPQAKPLNLGIMFVGLGTHPQRMRALSSDERESLLSDYDQLIAKHISQFGGQVIKGVEKGYLCSFPTAARALHCAKRLQGSFELYNGGLGPNSPHALPQPKIALDHGEVQQVIRSHGADITGVVLDRCARIFKVCHGGHILMSASLWDNAHFKVVRKAEGVVVEHDHLDVEGVDKIRLLEYCWYSIAGHRVQQQQDFARPLSRAASECP